MKESEKHSEFFRSVYKVARLIPKGRVTSYGAIAKYLGATRSARMVGWAMNQSFLQKISVPAHRVVNRNGLLTGKHNFTNPYQMQEALENDGVKVKNDCIQNFNDVYWDPIQELGFE